MIKFNSVNKYYNKGKQNEIHVLNDISLDLPERGMVAIFGKSGCGKTTLLNVIGGLDRYDNGSIQIENCDICKNTDEIRNRYMGYIFQNYNLNKEESCFDNVADALKLCGVTDGNEIEKRVMAALRNVGMDMYRNRTPDTLSGGQQQRIAIARAIVKNPPIILADEPTGNLDESNTLAIMELLKQIAKEHLVLLVTHEAKLVDYYCDSIIELQDGKVVGVRENDAVRAYSAKDKNDIYLGELSKSEVKNENTEMEFYGEPPAEPIKLTLVNSDGKIFIRINTPKVYVLDETSEVKLREGVYQEHTPVAESKNIDMSELTPINGKHFGKLFTFGSAIISGYTANFKKGKKGKKFLRSCMFMFAAVIVFVCAFFGSALDDILTIKENYNSNVYYVEVNENSQRILQSALNDVNSGIDFARLAVARNYYRGDDGLIFNLGSFESYKRNVTLRGSAVYLSESLCVDLPLEVGKKEDLADNEMVITTAVAKKLLDNSSLSSINKYSDLLGLTIKDNDVDSTIVGVVRSNETSVYLNDYALALYSLNPSWISGNTLKVISDNSINKGSTVLIVDGYDTDTTILPEIGETIQIHGIELNVENIIIRTTKTYNDWLSAEGKDMSNSKYSVRHNSATEYASACLKQLVNDDPESGDEGTDSWEEVYKKYYDIYFETLYNQYLSDHYFEYMDEYYAYYDEYMADFLTMKTDEYAWYAVNKNDFACKCLFMNGMEYYNFNDDFDFNYDIGVMYYYAKNYYGQNGDFPTYYQMREYFESQSDDGMSGYKSLYVVLDNLFMKMQNSYYQEYMQAVNNNQSNRFNGRYYLLNGEDYVAVSRQFGTTHASAYYNNYVTYYSGYFVVHSNDTSKTLNFLKSNLYNNEIVTPDDLFDQAIKSQMTSIITGLVALCVMIVLMSVCMYFIMRSSVMSRIKEVGIYRAVGVSKRNLIFRFFIEALVLTTLTVFIGFMFASIIMSLIYKNSILGILFYPVWYAVIVFVLLYAICLLCGVLPVLTLLKKTPSEILSKYDI